MKSDTIKGVTYRVFDDYNEFDNYHKELGVETPEVVDWMDTSHEGQWIEGTDGGIVQVLKYSPKIKHNRDTNSRSVTKGWLRTIVGTFVISKYREMDTQLDGRNKYRFSGKSCKEAKERRKTREKCSVQEEVFSALISTGQDIESTYIKVFGWKQPDVMRKEINFLLTRDRIMDKVKSVVTEIATKVGLDHEWVLSSLKNIATHSEDESVKYKAVIKIGETLGTFAEQASNKNNAQGGILFGSASNESPSMIEEADDKFLQEIKQAEEELNKLETEEEE